MKRSLEKYSSPYGELMAPLFYESLQLFLPESFFFVLAVGSSNSQRVTKSEKRVVIVSSVAFKKTQMRLRMESSSK